MVESEAGKGSTFAVLFPSLEGKREKPESGEGLGEEAAGKGTGTILIAEDEEEVSDVVSQMLRQIGFSVLTAADGQEAVDVFKAHADEISVVLLDLTMPRLSGEEVFEEITKIRGDVRVVFSSGFPEQEFAKRFSGKRFAGYLQKPYQYKSLESMMARVVKR
jgi:two-component system cell cycle sensor histidine kinase/response regulator CckA